MGATGAVGVELLRCLERREFPAHQVRLLASERSAGRVMDFHGRALVVEALDEDSFEGINLALFSAGSSVSESHAPVAMKAGAVVIDNSSAFRMDPEVPLVVPEVNASEIERHRGIIANPNCVAAITTVAISSLHAACAIRRLHAVTYQAASGAGAAAVEELRASTAAYLNKDAYEPRVLPHPYAFNLFSHNANVDLSSGYNSEELKVIAEIRRIMAANIPIGITCVRVPVLRAHAIALTLEFDEPLLPSLAKELLQSAPGIRVVDDWQANYFPMPSDASGQDDVLVGRIRTDLGDPSGRSLCLFVVGDQLLKGAALNAVQIAECLTLKR